MPRGPLAMGAVVALVAGLVFAPAYALASQGDAGTTSAYLQANYAFVQSAGARIGQFESKLRSLQHQIGQECPAAAAKSPENTDSEQLSNEVIGTMVLTASRVDVPAAHVFGRAVRGLRWSSGSLTRAVHGYASQVSRFASLAVPKLCADISSWAASAFQSLPASTVTFDRAFLSSWVAPGDLPSGLARYETAAQRPLLQRTERLENEVTELEAREVSTWGNIMNELNLLP